MAYGTITTLHESDLKFGLLYLGTDDGLVYRSDDAGNHWQKITRSLPESMWVTAVQASSHDTGRVYLSLNGYRWDHFDAYIYVSDDYGKSWERIGEDLPLEAVNVIKEDPKNEDILYVGTDHGLYISLDRGENFMFLNYGIPAVPVHDLAVQNRENDLVVGTHGRSIYKANMTEVQKLSTDIREKGIHSFKIPSVTYSESWGKKYNAWKDASEPKIEMVVYVNEDAICEMQVITDSTMQLYSRMDTLKWGLNYLSYDLTFEENALNDYQDILKKKDKEVLVEKAENEKFYLRPGKYDIHWIKPGDDNIEIQKLEIKNREKK